MLSCCLSLCSLKIWPRLRYVSVFSLDLLMHGLLFLLFQFNCVSRQIGEYRHPSARSEWGAFSWSWEGQYRKFFNCRSLILQEVTSKRGLKFIVHNYYVINVYVARTLLSWIHVVSETRVGHTYHVYFEEFVTCPRVVSISMMPCSCNIEIQCFQCFSFCYIYFDYVTASFFLGVSGICRYRWIF